MKHDRHFAKLTACLCAALLCCGCQSPVQLKQRAAVQGLGLDRAGGLWQLTLQIFDPRGGEDGGGEGSYALLHGSGDTLAAAFDSAAVRCGQEIFLGSARVLAVGSGAAVSLRQALEYLSGDPQVSPALMVVQARGAADAIFPAQNGSQGRTSPAGALRRQLQLAEKDGRLPPCRLMDLLADLAAPGDGCILPLAAPAQDGMPALEGGAVLGGGALRGTLTPQQLEALGLARRGAGALAVSFAGPDGQPASALLEHFDSRVEVQVRGGRLHIAAALRASGRVTEWRAPPAGQLNGPRPDSLGHAAAGLMARRFSAALAQLCAMGCDPLRLADRLRRSDPAGWAALAAAPGGWEAALARADWEVQARCTLRPR